MALNPLTFDVAFTIRTQTADEAAAVAAALDSPDSLVSAIEQYYTALTNDTSISVTEFTVVAPLAPLNMKTSSLVLILAVAIGSGGGLVCLIGVLACCWGRRAKRVRDALGVGPSKRRKGAMPHVAYNVHHHHHHRDQKRYSYT